MTRLDVLIQVKKIIGGIFKPHMIFGGLLLASLFLASAVYAETVRDGFNARLLKIRSRLSLGAFLRKSFFLVALLLFAASSANAGLAKMYWIQNGVDEIQRANLDGSNIEVLVTGLSIPTSIALDCAGGKMYCTDKLGACPRIE